MENTQEGKVDLPADLSTNKSVKDKSTNIDKKKSLKSNMNRSAKKQKVRTEILKISIIVSVVASLIIGSFTFTLGFWVGGHESVRDAFGWDEGDSNSIFKESSSSKIEVSSTEEESAIIDAVEENNNSVVSIIVSAKVSTYRSQLEDRLFNELFGDRGRIYDEDEIEKQDVGAGSGFIVSEDGLIVTNKHVVEGYNDAEFTVFTTEEDKEYKAKVVALDPTSDLALLDIEGEDFDPVTLGDSDDLKVGQTVVAIGNAIGQFRNTVSRGVISGLQRDIVASDGTGYYSETLSNIIQTDAAINTGNSGGPLLNIEGEVIGINVARSESGENIGFAIPVNEVTRAIESYKKEGKIVDDRAFLGVRYRMVNKQIKANYDLDVDYGAIILGEDAVVPESAADKAGLKVEDVILEVDGEKLDDDNTLSDVIDEKEKGDKVTLKILRDGKEKKIEVELGGRPEED